jgi:hypothetical protein
MRRGSLVLLVLGGAGCSTPTAVQVVVRNQADSFEFHSTALSKATDPRFYTWQNSGTQATVTLSTTSSGGTGRVIIRDAANVVVFDSGLEPALSELTQVGTAGSWHISITLTEFTGTLVLSVVKI